jgi:hypothetical protein
MLGEILSLYCSATGPEEVICGLFNVGQVALMFSRTTFKVMTRLFGDSQEREFKKLVFFPSTKTKLNSMV